MATRVEYDQTADAIYIQLRATPFAFGKNLDDERRIYYDADEHPIGIELLEVSRGVNLDDLPCQDVVTRALLKKNIKMYAC